MAEEKKEKLKTKESVKKEEQKEEKTEINKDLIRAAEAPSMQKPMKDPVYLKTK